MEKGIEKKNQQKLTGVVISDKMKDTVVVRVDRYVKHAKYDKFFTKSSKFKAHDPGNPMSAIIFCATSLLVIPSVIPPTQYVWPISPFWRMSSMARQWSRTNNQSRIFLLEQLYRAMMIAEGRTYHY
jgi:hypothetical protein